jgi:NADH-quinone oxidoreductase subunit N
MNAPFLWIIIPLSLAGVLLFVHNQRIVTLVACLMTFILATFACFSPIDTAINLGSLSFKISSSFNILGRHLIIGNNDRSLMAIIYGFALVWFSLAPAVKISRYFTSLGLAITAILIAALTVEPFLYAALLIETAVLLSIPLLLVHRKGVGHGLLRFLIFQTLAMPFILFSGWLLAGIEANPGDLDLVRQAAILIGLGFSFLLAVFPFHSWIPMLTEESNPYIIGFVLWMFPTVTIFFGLGFLDHYTWLRDSSSIGIVMLTVGTLMVMSGGLLVAFQQHLGRIMGYAVIIQTGFSILALYLGATLGMKAFFILFIPRGLGLIIWAFSLTIIKENSSTLNLLDLKGVARFSPFASSGMVLANLSMAGMPILAGFPPLLGLLGGLASTFLPIVIWILVGTFGLILSAVHVIVTLAPNLKGVKWESRETLPQRIFLISGALILVLLGLFPQWALPLWTRLPVIFTHLGQ